MANIKGTLLDDILDAVALGFSGQNNLIDGLEGKDTLIGGSVNDQLIGGLGQDSMRGGMGDDVYTVDAEDRPFDIIENANEGLDTIISPVNWTLRDNFETLRLIHSATTGTGNSLDNTIIGNNFDNTLQGLQGNDTLKGLAGNDRLEGGSGSDNLDGGTGDDTLVGRGGNDQYFVNSTNDVIVESAGGGTDLVFASVDGYTLSGNVENLFLSGMVISGTGNSNNNYIQGNQSGNTIDGLGGNDFLNGRGGDDTLNGGDGNDRLDGGSGTNTLNGGFGNDNYFVRNASDVITENVGEGTDTVYAVVDVFVLPTGQEVENLILVQADPLNPMNSLVAVTGTGNTLNNTITGNTLNNTLNGGDGTDTLNGGEGNDILNGDEGNDILSGDANNDKLNGGNGNDILNGGDGNDDLKGDVGDDTLKGDAGNDTLNGGDGVDILTGGMGNDTLVGGAGDDILMGDPGATSGADKMTGGAGNDIFVLGDSTMNFYDDGNPATDGNTTDYATIQDFTTGDLIQLKNAIADYKIEIQGTTNVKIRTNEATPEVIGIVHNTTVADVIAALTFV